MIKKIGLVALLLTFGMLASIFGFDLADKAGNSGVGFGYFVWSVAAIVLSLVGSLAIIVGEQI